MRQRQTLPHLWLLSDERNDRVLERRLRTFPAPIGFVFRHYHLAPAQRAARFAKLGAVCRKQGHLILLAGAVDTARRWGADGVYGAPRSLAAQRYGLPAIATAHDLRDIAQANRLGADAIMLSPVFPTRSHPGARTLGPLRFRLMAGRAQAPVIALGGLNARTIRRLGWARWAAIDGLS